MVSVVAGVVATGAKAVSTVNIELNKKESKIKELYEKAKPYYEKAKELKPDNKALWGNYLLNIYWKLNRAEYDSLEKELGY